MGLIPGTRLGVYEVGAGVGVGGMGEVYRATLASVAEPTAVDPAPLRPRILRELVP